MAKTEVAALVADFVIPVVGEVIVVALSQAVKMVEQMKENEEMCRRVYRRFEFVHEELQKLTDDAVIRDNNVLSKYGVNMASFLAFLKKHSQKGFIKRLAGNRKVLEAVQEFHNDMDQLFRLLNIAHMAEMTKWMLKWEEDQASAHKEREEILESNAAVAAEVQDQGSNTTESLALILYELQSMRDRNSADQLALMNKAFGKVVTMSNTNVPAVPEWFIPSDDVDFNAVSFDIGSYGSVHRGTYLKGTNVVIKRLLTDDQDAKASFFREVEVWSTLNNPHIVRLFGACHVSTPAFFVCEDATGGNFVDRFEEDRSELWRLFYEAALGLFYLHSRKVVHGDLKCNNIVIGADNRAKLIDFGFAFVRKHSAGLSAKSQTEAIRWKAPECMLPEEEEPNPQFNPRFASDVFSFGMCIIEAFLGEPPYGIEDDDIVMEKKFSGEMYPRVGNMTDDEWTFVERLLDADWKTRMPLEKAIDTLKAFADREAATKAVDAAAPETRLSAGLSAVTLDDQEPEQGKYAQTASTRPCPTCTAIMPIEFNFCGKCTATMLSRSKTPQAPVLLECVSERCAVKIVSTDRFCRHCGAEQNAYSQAA
jgi:hypothetical protein